MKVERKCKIVSKEQMGDAVYMVLEAGDMVTAIRRLLCSASEDVGLAYPQAVPIVKACVDLSLIHI